MKTDKIGNTGISDIADGDGWYLLTAEGANRYYDYLGEDDAE